MSSHFPAAASWQAHSWFDVHAIHHRLIRHVLDHFCNRLGYSLPQSHPSTDLKYQWQPSAPWVKLRMGIGLFMTCIAMVVSVMVEQIRRYRAIERMILHSARQDVTMSAMWLIPQCALHGLAEGHRPDRILLLGVNMLYRRSEVRVRL